MQSAESWTQMTIFVQYDKIAYLLMIQVRKTIDQLLMEDYMITILIRKCLNQSLTMFFSLQVLKSLMQKQRS